MFLLSWDIVYYSTYLFQMAIKLWVPKKGLPKVSVADPKILSGIWIRSRIPDPASIPDPRSREKKRREKINYLTRPIRRLR
jgi:hypothetical protein